MWTASVSKARLVAKMLPTNATTMYESMSTITAISLGLFWTAADVACTNLWISQRALRCLHGWAYFRQDAFCDAEVADVEPAFLDFHAAPAIKLI
jgi:hypothetical protein